MSTGKYSRCVVWCAVATALAGQAIAEENNVEFPDNYRQGVHYATVERGSIREELYANQVAIDAVKAGQPLPTGTVLTMEDYRFGQLFRYIVMEKGDSWGEKYPPASRTGDWEFQSFQPSKSINANETLGRCMGCHQSQRENDFVFTYERLKSAALR